jgi:hypothetical protein
MNADQYHLGKIAEEAVEVAQRALKAQQFGLGEVQPGQDFDNLERLMGEFHDLFTTFENFCDLVGANPIPDGVKRHARLRKMKKFLQLSKDLGQVDENATI